MLGKAPLLGNECDAPRGGKAARTHSKPSRRGGRTPIGPRHLRLLLASSSIAALFVGGAPGAFAQCAIDPTTNQSSVNNSGAVNCINIQGISVAGTVTNTSTGAITAFGLPPTGTGITITTTASVGGSVSNAGTINASVGGIDVNGPVFGGIANSGPSPRR